VSSTSSSSIYSITLGLDLERVTHKVNGQAKRRVIELGGVSSVTKGSHKDEKSRTNEEMIRNDGT
jgi:hypothetical protein